MRTSPIGGKDNVKIYILYLMNNIGYPLDSVMINDIVLQAGYVVFLDFAECFNELIDGDLIEVAYTEKDIDYYQVTSKGRLVAEELKGDVIYSVLEQSLEEALRYIDFQKRKVETGCTIERLGDGSYNVTVFLKERQKTIMQSSIVVDSRIRAEKFKRNFSERPDVIYRGICALLAGNVNYLFDKHM
ncbi:MAG: DUF4364 family protein [Clostridia bacterium]|nr:DUF4364 family protein [Clostridia bacterium]